MNITISSPFFRVTLALAVTASGHALQAAAPAGQREGSPGIDGFSPVSAAAEAAPTSEGMSEKTLKQLAELDKFDPFDPRRADVLERLARRAQNPADRTMWYQQMADTLSAAAQMGNAPDGLGRLQTLLQRLRRENADRALVAYVEFRIVSARYTQRLQAPGADYAAIQEEYNKSLKRFVSDYPTSPDAAEAMLQLGIAEEFAAQEDGAKQWYRSIIAEFPDSRPAAKAAGAIVRLESVGKRISLSGKSTTGEKIRLADYRGKVVLIHYWATWSGASKNDLTLFKELVAKHGPQLAIIGVNLDSDVKDLNNCLAENKLSWPQIFEEGGMESAPANQLGILTVPTIFLLDQEGRVVNSAVPPEEVESEVKKLLRQASDYRTSGSTIKRLRIR